MSENSKIEWTDHTFNPWWGCVKVHRGCKNCYAESWDARWGGDHWGPSKSRRMILGEWGKPLRWNAMAKAAGRKALVFCASMADLFEDFDGRVVDQLDKEVINPATKQPWTVPLLRARTCDLIDRTPELVWLLLTKRPENISKFVPIEWLDRWPKNVMVGTSPCDQATAAACIPSLLQVPGPRFLSVEPMMGPLDLEEWITEEPSAGLNILARFYRKHEENPEGKFDPEGRGKPFKRVVPEHGPIDWVIIGSESKGDLNGELPAGGREEWLSWAIDLVKVCQFCGIPVFVKQIPGTRHVLDSFDDPEWPDVLKVRQMPRIAA